MAREVLLDNALIHASLKIELLKKEMHDHLLDLVVPEKLIFVHIIKINPRRVAFELIYGLDSEFLRQEILREKIEPDHKCKLYFAH